MIALGSKDGRYFPVFIELKATRSFDRVMTQLIDTHREVAKVDSDFVEMLAGGTGKDVSSIAFDEYKLFVVWPKAKSGKGHASATKAVNNTRFESARGHLLLGEFPIPEVASDGFDSVVGFVESA